MYIYWVYNAETSLTKIGITEDIERRISQIENGCGAEIKQLCCVELRDEIATAIETLLHAILKSCNTRGEWFKVKRSHVLFLMSFFTSSEVFGNHSHKNGYWLFEYKKSTVPMERIIEYASYVENDMEETSKEIVNK